MKFEQISKFLYEDFLVFKKKINIEQLDELLSPEFQSKQIPYTQNTLTAVIHKSFKHETNIELDHNEKLEFLGDSVLQLIVSEILFQTYPEKSEGDLSKLRSSIVNEASLAKLARLIKLDRLILLGKGEFKEEGHKKASILANTYEALLGALYLDHGLAIVREFILGSLDSYKREYKKDLLAVEALNTFDAKTKLQEYIVKKHKVNPEYICKEIDVKGKKEFHIELHIGDEMIDEITFYSKKKGMQELAKKVLEQKNI